MTIDEEAFNKACKAYVSTGSSTQIVDRSAMKAAITAYLTALEAKGLCIAPVEPTEGMVKAGSIPLRGTGPQMDIAPSWAELLAESAYRAMLAARGE